MIYKLNKKKIINKMKRFLLLLLVAVAASVSVDFDGTELEGWWKNLWGNITAFLSKLSGEAKKIYKWLKDNGYWDIIVSLVKKFAVPAAIGGIGLCRKRRRLDRQPGRFEWQARRRADRHDL